MVERQLLEILLDLPKVILCTVEDYINGLSGDTPKVYFRPDGLLKL